MEQKLLPARSREILGRYHIVPLIAALPGIFGTIDTYQSTVDAASD